MAAPEITLALLGRAEAAERAEEFGELHAEVHADRAGDGAMAGFADWFAVQRRQPGFALAEARHGGYLVGFAFGVPLRPATSFWRDLTAPLPAEITTERPGRTFALAELAVRAPWRRQGIGRDLHDLVLTGRPEERATLTVPPSATAAQRAGQAWGWRKIARKREQLPGAPLLDILIMTLPGDGRGR
jgi:GNAT superfamily N-acetyltransferase